MSIIVFPDAGPRVDYGQLSDVAGVLFGMLSEESLTYIISWFSHKSKCHVKSVQPA